MVQGVKTNRCKYLFIFLVCFSAGIIHAQQIIHGSISGSDTLQRIDYLNKVSEGYIGTNKLDSASLFASEALQLAQHIHYNKGEATALYHIGDVYTSKGKYKKALSHFLRSLRLKHEVKDKSLSVNLYYKMANVLARLKLYPQALKYYYKMMQAHEVGKNKNNYVYLDYSNKTLRDSTTEKVEASAVDSSIMGDVSFAPAVDPSMEMPDDTTDNMVKDIVADSIENSDSVVESQPIDNKVDITSCYNDGKKAIGYGLMVHVKQPTPGKRKAFAKISNVGHTFVTLIKFNADSTTVCRSFGFYPKKDNLLSATPLIPTSTSVFKDDSLHNWDEVVGKFISKRKFDKILKLVREYKCKKYNLNYNNCTDFGLDVAAIAGIKIKDTIGYWPFGKGNNPANAGQSILEGKVKDEENKNDLLIINTTSK
jgi:hypothetical protein